MDEKKPAEAGLKTTRKRLAAYGAIAAIVVRLYLVRVDRLILLLDLIRVLRSCLACIGVVIALCAVVIVRIAVWCRSNMRRNIGAVIPDMPIYINVLGKG
jgi:hypothetical protein